MGGERKKVPLKVDVQLKSVEEGRKKKKQGRDGFVLLSCRRLYVLPSRSAEPECFTVRRSLFHGYKCSAAAREGRAEVGANFCEEPPPPPLSEKTSIHRLAAYSPTPRPETLPQHRPPTPHHPPSSSHPSKLFFFFLPSLSLSLLITQTNFVEVGFAFRG